MLTGNVFEIGHGTNRSGGRQRTFVIIRCVHGTEDAPKEYLSQHDDYDRLEMSQRAEVIDTAIRDHRENLQREHGVRCDCTVPDDFRVNGQYLAGGYS